MMIVYKVQFHYRLLLVNYSVLWIQNLNSVLFYKFDFIDFKVLMFRIGIKRIAIL
jgi:hypothetical protein